MTDHLASYQVNIELWRPASAPLHEPEKHDFGAHELCGASAEYAKQGRVGCEADGPVNALGHPELALTPSERRVGITLANEEYWLKRSGMPMARLDSVRRINGWKGAVIANVRLLAAGTRAAAR